MSRTIRISEETAAYLETFGGKTWSDRVGAALDAAGQQPDFTKTSPEDVRRECLEAVRGPGKFQGEPVYVPYFWDAGRDGLADVDQGRVQRFRVSTEDRKLFPELRRKRWVTILETDDGFVVEV